MENRNSVLIIAEAGVNHNGSLLTAKQLADAAKASGADIVKYQLFNADKLASTRAQKAQYQKQNTYSNESQRDMLQKLELSFDEFKELKSYCDAIGIEFWATSFDVEGTEFLVRDLGVSRLKIPSGEINDYPYLVNVGSFGLPVILSCGMSTIPEIRAAICLLRESGAGDITLLHCNTQYPTPYQDVNLLAMVQMGEDFGVQFGYSDHTLGIEVPIAATALGASVIEKHFTLNRDFNGPDHRASLTPRELESMVRSVRNIEKSLGNSKKNVTRSEAENRAVARKSIVAARPIVAGEAFTEENLTTKRPGDGVDPMRWPELIGTFATRNYDVDEQVTL